MKIIINAYQYAPAVTGTDRMAKNFLAELQKVDAVNDYFIVCSAEDYIPDVITAKNFRLIRPPVMPPSNLRRIVYKLWRGILPFLIASKRADVYYTFHNMRLPKHRIAKRMLTSNLDLIPLQLEQYENLDSSLVNEIKRTAESADAFVSISNFSKKELCEILAVDEEKVHVIHLAADPSFTSKHSHYRTRLKLPKNFILTIGGSEPRKNVVSVVNAFCKLSPALQKKYPLVIAGGAWHGIQLESLKKNENIYTLGYVSDVDLAYLYRHSTVFVFASLYEGFGFTILEAMACGAPSLSANSSSLPEVAGDAALLFSPVNSEELMRKLENVLTDSRLRKKMNVAGLRQSERFTWSEAAYKLHRLLTS